MDNNRVFNETKELDAYTACAIAEGFCEGEGASANDQLKAWAYLIRTGQCWSLQGWFGRSANALIERGVISPEGEIDWNMVHELMED